MKLLNVLNKIIHAFMPKAENPVIDIDVRVSNGMKPVPEVIPVEERIKTAIPSSHSLYPHEILVLHYAHTYYSSGNSYQKFWWYRYGVKDVDTVLSSLMKRGFVQVGDLKSALEKQTVETLKNTLRTYGLKVSGKKAELVQRLLEEVPHEELDSLFPRKPLQLTELGKDALKEAEYVPYIHTHQLEDLDIWSLNKLVQSEPYLSYRDKIWRYLNQRSIEHAKNGDFGLYRNLRHSMYKFLVEENSLREALAMLAEVVYYDLSSLDNNWDPSHLHLVLEYCFPYENSIATIPPGIIKEIVDCQKQLGISDEELKSVLLERMNILSAPMHLFTPEECVEIIFLEIRKDSESLKNMYEKAQRRFKKAYGPTIKEQKNGIPG